MLPESHALPDTIPVAVPFGLPDHQRADNCDPDAPYPDADRNADIAAQPFTHAADRPTGPGRKPWPDAPSHAAPPPGGARHTNEIGVRFFNLSGIGQMRKTRADKREDFHDVYRFDDGFSRDLAFVVPDPV